MPSSPALFRNLIWAAVILDRRNALPVQIDGCAPDPVAPIAAPEPRRSRLCGASSQIGTYVLASPVGAAGGSMRLTVVTLSMLRSKEAIARTPLRSAQATR